ncbi:hypothetical protein OKW21_003518 [Catalinimonas alkaloidigena]|uniref:hypothetical protein n=1 Tax=Catalinimonas alkaloidigena TaxID=1075417 RepID=UPI002404F615|nr:hypothetical protein [Catalinimonas alkaloidigena]MDF9798255.1 hypothetical protein [Catalinimonas alkaloidigena]
MEDTTTQLQVWLDFVSTFFWQVIVVVMLFYFRIELKMLFQRLAKFKFGEAEFSFQPEVAEATSPGGEADSNIEKLGASGFFTREGIREIINDSELVGKGEQVVDEILIFRTSQQRTWLVATEKHLFCILDDEDTRASGKVIQWKLALKESSPVSAGLYKARTGLLNIGPKKGWLYSKALYNRPQELEQAVSELIQRAKN